MGLIVSVIGGAAFTPVLFVLLPVCAYFLFSGAVGMVQGIGPVYWILKPDNRWVSIGIGTMHELNHPWRVGRGLYLVLVKWSLQVGLCRRQSFTDEEGTLSAVRGRYMDVTAKEIGQW